jgi:hypothetical protein
MSRSFALLTIAAFALSAPINARTLLTAGETGESQTTAGMPADMTPPECTKATSEVASATEETGGMPDTQAAAAGAEVQACCWYLFMGRWYCLQC